MLLQAGGDRDAAARCGAKVVATEHSRREPGRSWPTGSWLVVTGDEDGKTNVIAGKPQTFKAVSRLEWHKSLDEEYTVKAKNGRKRQGSAFSRVLVAELVFVKPWCGRESIKIANLHTHFRTAKKSVRAPSTQQFYVGLYNVIRRHRPQLMCGDFNMSLYNLVAAFHGRLQPVLLASYAWRSGVELTEVTEVDEDEVDDEDDAPPPPPPLPRPAVVGTQPAQPPPLPQPAVVGTQPAQPTPQQQPLPPGIPPPPSRPAPRFYPEVVGTPAAQPPQQQPQQQPVVTGLQPASAPPPPPKQPAVEGASSSSSRPPLPVGLVAAGSLAGVRLNSCGIFSLVPVASMKSTISLATLQPDSDETKNSRVFARGQGYPVTSYVGGVKAFTDTMAARQSAVAVDGVPSLPPAVHKNVTPSKFDAMGLLFRGGAHAPLMAFLGQDFVEIP